MDKRYGHLLREYHEARRAYLRAKVQLLEHILKLRRAKRARQPRPIELPGYDRG